MKDDKARKVLELNTRSLEVVASLLDGISENMEKNLLIEMGLIQEIKKLKERVAELEKKREWVN